MGTRGRDDPPDPSVRQHGRANEQGLRALGDQIGGRARSESTRGGSTGDLVRPGRPGRTGRNGRTGRKRWSTRRKILTPLISLVVLAALVAGGSYVYLRYRFDQIPKVTVTSEHKVAAGSPFNMLVIGSDSRVGAKASTGVGTSTVVGGQRSDVVMIWHIVPAHRTITILSIPRDLLTQMVGSNRTQFGEYAKINTSYNSGVTLLVQTIQDNFGIPINHVVQVDFAGFKGAVNALGGVYMNFEYPAKDAYSGLNVTATGCQLLNGTEALAVARSRHYEYEETGQWIYTPLGDLARIRRQDSFLDSLVDAAKSKYNPLQLNAFLGSLPQGIALDQTFSLGEMVGLAEDFHSITPSTIVAETLPTLTGGDVTGYGDALFVDQPADQQLLVSIFGSELTTPTTPPPNETFQPELPPSTGATTTGTTSTSTGTQGNAYTSTELDTTPSYDPTPCSP